MSTIAASISSLCAFTATILFTGNVPAAFAVLVSVYFALFSINSNKHESND